jgi:hypothetical protein
MLLGLVECAHKSGFFDARLLITALNPCSGDTERCSTRAYTEPVFVQKEKNNKAE